MSLFFTKYKKILLSTKIGMTNRHVLKHAETLIKLANNNVIHTCHLLFKIKIICQSETMGTSLTLPIQTHRIDSFDNGASDWTRTNTAIAQSDLS